jgi:RimJ/RimL family protein N-acetyltransferase
MSFQIVFEDWPHPHGLMRYGHIPWDSDIFGFPFYQLTISEMSEGLAESLPELLNFLCEQGEDKCLVCTKIPSHEVTKMRTLVEHGFYPIETMVEPYRDLRSFSGTRRFERLSLRLATVADKPQLFSIARSAFSMDRYHLDPNLPDDRASYRYEFWLENGMKSGDHVWVYRDSTDDRLVGFCHLREIDKGVVDFSLAAIEPKFQKSGFGVMMYSECLMECKKMGYAEIVTRISLNNIAVLNIYAHLGFLFRQPTVTFHCYADHSERMY